jgi:two-component system response regulator YesN
MYKVLLVDDEPLAIEGLMLMIDWSSLGFEICGVCENGIEAQEMIRTCKPDVVVTDIEMPFMNGLELIEHVRHDSNEDIVFVVLSGYNEFEYARKALVYGVHHYMLKPFIDEEAIEVLTDIHQKLEERRLKSELIQYDLHTKLEHTLSDILDGKLEELDEQQLVELSILSDKALHWCYLHVKLEESVYMDVRAAVKRCLNSRDIVIIMDHDLRSLGLIYGFRDLQDIRQIVNDLNVWIKQSTTAKFGLCIGEPMCSLGDIRASYLGALAASSHLFFNYDQTVVFQQDVTNPLHSDNPILFNKAICILESMESIDEARLDQTISEVFSEFQAARISQEFTRIFIHHVIHQSMSVLHDYGEDTSLHMKQYLLVELNQSTTSLGDMERLLREYCLDYQQHVRTIRASRSNDLLPEVLAFLHEHYAEDLTIKEVANKHYVHPVYLGKAFTDKHGMGIREYLYMLRINVAKKLLRETELKANMVAERVGYTSYTHFLRHFERWVGQKPSDYRSDHMEL